VTDLLLKRSRIALNEVYDVVCKGRIVGRIMLTNVLAPYWSWTLAYSFHEGRTPSAATRRRSKPRCRRSRKAGTWNEWAAFASLAQWAYIQP
jgi:hypothetical protein